VPYHQTNIRVGIDSGDVRGADNRAIQMAVDALPAAGGTVEVLPGTYVCADSVHLRSNMRLTGTAGKTILRRADGFRQALVISADYGQLKATPANISPFRVGQGLYLRDGRSAGFTESVVTVDRIEGGAIHFKEPLVMDYSEDEGGEILASGAVISGIDVVDVVIDGIVVDGNKEKNFAVDGCQSGGVYFHRASRVSMNNLEVRDFAGDGISFQTTQDFTLTNVRITGCTNYGVHPGTGSARVLMRNCTFTGNEVGGFFLCWRVQESRFEDLVCDGNAGWGVNIGHKDTGNVFSRCSFSHNGRVGVLFRAENPRNGGHRNRFENCSIVDNGEVGIEVNGHAYDVDFVSSTIRDTRGAAARQRVGIVLGEDARRFRSVDCKWEGHPDGNVKDHSGKAGGHHLDA
jgi:hypothetical protein